MIDLLKRFGKTQIEALELILIILKHTPMKALALRAQIFVIKPSIN